MTTAAVLVIVGPNHRPSTPNQKPSPWQHSGGCRCDGAAAGRGGSGPGVELALLVAN